MNLDLEHFRARVIQDALTQATAEFWIRKARDFENAIGRPGDYLGQTTPEMRAEHDDRMRQIAIACRRHASLISLKTEISPEVYAVLAEAA